MQQIKKTTISVDNMAKQRPIAPYWLVRTMEFETINKPIIQEDLNIRLFWPLTRKMTTFKILRQAKKGIKAKTLK